MDSRQETIKKIKNLLRFHRNGLTITDISQKLRLNRNSTAKYLEILLISGDVDLNTYGPAKVYTFSRKVPISAILKFSADIILLIDNEMRVLDANESALSILEMSREDLIGNLIEKVNSPLIARLAIPDVFKEIHTSGEVQREFAVTRQNEDRHYRVRLIPTIFDNREEGVTIIGEDITEQIRFEESLMISESRYRAIVQDQTDFICRWRPGGDITFINETLSRFGGISCSAIQEQSIFSFVSPEDHPLVKEKIAQLTPGNPTISSELRLRDRNGSYCWHLWSTRGIYDDTGTLVECQSVGRDISEVKQVEAALHKSEQLYRNILENIQDIYYRCDMDGKIVMISPSGPALMGYDSVEEIIGLNIAENFYLYPEDRKKFLETLYREQKVNDCEVTLKKRDGSPVYVSTNSQIFYDPSGNETYIEGFIRDITLRKRDEEALRESEQKFRSLVEQTFDAILILDLIGTILFANNAAARIVEAKDSAGLIGRNVMEFVAPECREEVIRDFVEVSKGHDSYLTYYHATSETGKKIYLECIGKVISYEGKPADLVSIRDITEQKKAEAVLRQSEENFRTVLENLPDLVLVHRNGIIIYVNPLMVRTLGIAPAEVLDKPFIDYIAPDHRERVAASIRKQMEEARSEPDEIEIQSRTGERRIVIVRGTRINFGGSPAILNVLTDITERKRSEKVLAESEAKLALVMNGVPTLIGYIDSELRFVYANKAHEEWYGLTEKKLIGKSLKELLPEDVFLRAFPYYQQVFQGQEVNFENPTRDRHGREHVMSVRLVPHFRDKKVVGFFAALEEITESKRLEAVLRESEERYRTITEFFPFPISVIDASGNYRYLNKGFTDLFGYTLAEIPTGKDWLKKAFPDMTDRTRAMLMWKNEVAHLPPSEVRPGVFPVTCKDGTVRQIKFFPVTLPGGDHFVVYEDLTLKSESERLRSVLASIVNFSNDAIIGKTLDGTIISWNKAAERMYGYSADEIIGQSIAVIIVPELREQLPVFLQKIRAGECIEHFKTTRIRKGGSCVKVSVTLSPIKDEQGRIIGVSTIAKNISDFTKDRHARYFGKKYFPE